MMSFAEGTIVLSSRHPGKSDLSEHQDSAIRASEIVLAADESYRSGEMIRL